MGPWFFVSTEILQQGTVLLPPEVLRHLKVLRLQEGDALILSDGKGKAYRARLTLLQTRAAEAVILDELTSTNEPWLEVTLYPGITKGEKMDLVVRQAVELGVRRIVPVLAERSVVRLSGTKKKEKALRWQKIARSAAEQCRRSYIPPVAVPMDPDELLQDWRREKYEAIIIPWEEERGNDPGREPGFFARGLRKVAVFSGPEGGISGEEIDRMRTIPGVRVVGLGPRILRAETAPVALLSIIMYCHGELGG